MKKLILLGAMVCALGMMTACGDKDKSDLIIGEWDVQTEHVIRIDYYQDTFFVEEHTWNISDTAFAAFYDAAEFFDGGIMRWHLNEMYDEYYSYHFDTLKWSVEKDVLLLQNDPDSLGFVVKEYEIKELNNNRLVLKFHERVRDDYNPSIDYDYTQDYIFKRRNN